LRGRENSLLALYILLLTTIKSSVSREYALSRETRVGSPLVSVLCMRLATGATRGRARREDCLGASEEDLTFRRHLHHIMSVRKTPQIAEPSLAPEAAIPANINLRGTS
jgi:hypothetical protein